ncbi:hypothetical protein G9U52_11910 [Paenibacillus sp. S3N08]|uniref:Uncharacterized protein n=2 Tax=Paenibacillus agricola TaxID=2716264 RepID=A0ABX0J6Q2_9BACL|nr:hypothetical protein [Paenibacillus agricola]
MQIIATFGYSVSLELAISSLELEGIKKEHIFAVPLTIQKTERRMFDTIHNADGISLISTGAALGTAFSVIGASVGFSLQWGPIYWGLIGAVGGFLLGFLIDIFINKIVKNRQRLLRGKNPVVILIIDCKDEQADRIEHILWHHFALGTARVIV